MTASNLRVLEQRRPLLRTKLPRASFVPVSEAGTRPSPILGRYDFFISPWPVFQQYARSARVERQGQTSCSRRGSIMKKFAVALLATTVLGAPGAFAASDNQQPQQSKQMQQNQNGQQRQSGENAQNQPSQQNGQRQAAQMTR
ncbi:hypothetical protein [Bradyrhizobium sp. USDA 4451]